MDHFKTSTINFQWDLKPDCSLAMSLMNFLKKCFYLLCSVTRCIIVLKKITSTSPNQFSINGLRKLSKISMCTCVLIVEVMIAISPVFLNDMQSHIMDYLGNLLEFFRHSSLYISFKRHPYVFSLNIL